MVMMRLLSHSAWCHQYCCGSRAHANHALSDFWAMYWRERWWQWKLSNPLGGGRVFLILSKVNHRDGCVWRFRPPGSCRVTHYCFHTPKICSCFSCYLETMQNHRNFVPKRFKFVFGTVCTIIWSCTKARVSARTDRFMFALSRQSVYL